MECMEARALKSSFSSELAMNLSCFPDDYLCVTTTTINNNNNNTNNTMPSDDFSIDDYFNLPNENEDGVINDGEIEEKDGCCSFSLSSYEDNYFEEDNSTHFSTELAIPVDDVQELELWSHLMDDSSIPEPTIACPKPVLDCYREKTGFNFVNRVEPVCKPGSVKVPVITSAVPVKPRSKRLRTGNRSWIFNSSPKTESSSSSSSSASSPVSTLFFPPPVHEFGMFFTFGKPPVEKKKKRPAVVASVGENPPVQRRCSHCQVTKTPQWRAGPNGPKTLCNACGVRFKSGRLFPEYRPACSPTFSSEVHSNSHRKVLEMRKKKEGEPLSSCSTSTVLSS